MINFVFMGTPEVASKTLQILKEGGYLPSLIVTSPDKPQGRRMIITPPPVKTWAIENDIPYFQPERINQEFIDRLTRGSATADLYVVVAYGKILPEELINLPKLGTINIHYSLLPKYRGASPLEACLLNGDLKTGVCIQQMAYKLDSGPLIALKEIEININETKDNLREKLIKEGAEMLVNILPKIINKEISPKIQNENEATFCKKITKEDGLIDLNEDPKILYNKYRAYSGWPGIYFFKDSKRIKITKAKYENHSFIIEQIIPEGKKEINYSDFLKI